MGQPKRLENVNILVANTAMDTDKIKIYGARVRVDSMAKVSNLAGQTLAICCTGFVHAALMPLGMDSNKSSGSLAAQGSVR